MKSVSFKASFERGQIHTQIDKPLFDNFKHGLKDGARLKLTFSKDEETRSQRSNRLFHALVGRYAKQEGVAAPRAKIDFKGAWGVTFPIVKGFECNRLMKS